MKLLFAAAIALLLLAGCSNTPDLPKPAAPREPDPIVGAYVFYLNEVTEEALVVRIYPNKQAKSDFNHRFRWERVGNQYDFYYQPPRNDRPEEKFFSVKYQEVKGEPALISFSPKVVYWEFEGVKHSSNPDYLFDHYWLSTDSSYDTSKWFCINTGRKEKRHKKAGIGLGIPQYGETREICEARCPLTISIKFSGATCPQDRI